MIKTLGGLDALFLHLESEAMPLHVGSLHVYELPPGARGDVLSRTRKHLAQRLHLSPVFTRKLAPTPLKLSNPAWIDDPDVDLEYHVRRVTLPAPGSRRELEQCAAKLHSRMMDRSRPLWEFYVIEGLDAPGKIGFYSKVHHAAIDGKAGVVMAQAILDLAPEGRRIAPPSDEPAHEEPGTGELLRVALASQVAHSRKLISLLPAMLKAGGAAAGEAITTRLKPARKAAADHPRNESGLFGFGPRTRFNTTINGERGFATAEVTIADLKSIAGALGGTINDVVLALCSGALRHYLAELRELPDEPLVAFVPVSLRQEGDTEQNTQATMFRVPLGTHIADPRARYRAVLDASAEMKQAVARLKSVVPTDFPSVGLPWLLPGLASLYGRSHVADVMRPPANLVISNVPGPRIPLYLAGSRMLTYWPVSAVAHGMGLNITVESYVDTLYFGIVACRKAMPNAERLADLVRAAHAELMGLARAAAAPDAVAKGTSKAASRGAPKSAPPATAGNQARRTPRARPSR